MHVSHESCVHARFMLAFIQHQHRKIMYQFVKCVCMCRHRNSKLVIMVSVFVWSVLIWDFCRVDHIVPFNLTVFDLIYVEFLTLKLIVVYLYS